ncbi:MAG TPA: hypothetical protein VFW65_12400 [Pseudonocardiaceae bacterium]|nr:hypothetical protein [Pseudonocardiaceae bacterium]
MCEANRYGQQLFIADLFRQKRPEPPPQPTRLTNWPTCYPVAHRQPVLFDAEHDYTTTRAFALTPPLPGLVDALEQVLVEHAAGHGWSQGLETNTRGALRILLATQDTPGAAIAASHAAAVSTGRRWNNFKSVLEILAQTGMLDDDRPDTLDGYFARHTAGLPEPMATEFGQWYHVLRHGRDTPPRYRPRSVPTTRIHILCAARMLHAWANAGHQSLREISRDDVLTTLPDKPYQRHRTLTALRFLFRFLKAHRIVFTDPTTRLRGDIVTGNQPLPTDLDRLREAVRSPQPVRAALAVLVAFHGLRNHELSTLLLTEIHDARLHQKRRTILLAEPVRAKLAAWLDERARRWPSTVNPHLFVNLHSAVHTGPVHREWITRTIGVSAQAIREDRILNEALTTGGDIRRLCDLFGLTIGGAERYIRGTEQPPLGSGTQAPT